MTKNKRVFHIYYIKPYFTYILFSLNVNLLRRIVIVLTFKFNTVTRYNFKQVSYLCII